MIMYLRKAIPGFDLDRFRAALARCKTMDSLLSLPECDEPTAPVAKTVPVAVNGDIVGPGSSATTMAPPSASSLAFTAAEAAVAGALATLRPKLNLGPLAVILGEDIVMHLKWSQPLTAEQLVAITDHDKRYKPVVPTQAANVALAASVSGATGAPVLPIAPVNALAPSQGVALTRPHVPFPGLAKDNPPAVAPAKAPSVPKPQAQLAFAPPAPKAALPAALAASTNRQAKRAAWKLAQANAAPAAQQSNQQVQWDRQQAAKAVAATVAAAKPKSPPAAHAPAAAAAAAPPAPVLPPWRNAAKSAATMAAAAGVLSAPAPPPKPAGPAPVAVRRLQVYQRAVEAAEDACAESIGRIPYVHPTTAGNSAYWGLLQAYNEDVGGGSGTSRSYIPPSHYCAVKGNSSLDCNRTGCACANRSARSATYDDEDDESGPPTPSQQSPAFNPNGSAALASPIISPTSPSYAGCVDTYSPSSPELTALSLMQQTSAPSSSAASATPTSTGAAAGAQPDGASA
jgi:hypothetical protein